MTFGKSLFLTKYRMRYAICMPPNTKDLAINQTGKTQQRSHKQTTQICCDHEYI